MTSRTSGQPGSDFPAGGVHRQRTYLNPPLYGRLLGVSKSATATDPTNVRQTESIARHLSDAGQITLEGCREVGGSYTLQVRGAYCELHCRKVLPSNEGVLRLVLRVKDRACSQKGCDRSAGYLAYWAQLIVVTIPPAPEPDPYIEPPDYVEPGPLLR